LIGDDECELFLVNFKGISKYFKAMKEENINYFLVNSFGLNDNQMDLFLAWLIEIREKFVLPITQS